MKDEFFDMIKFKNKDHFLFETFDEFELSWNLQLYSPYFSLITEFRTFCVEFNLVSTLG